MLEVLSPVREEVVTVDAVGRQSIFYQLQLDDSFLQFEQFSQLTSYFC